MGIKSFFIKKTLQMKGVPAEQAEMVAKQLSENPELADSLKSLEKNPEIKELFENIQKEIAEQKKSGMPDNYAAVAAMEKYKGQIAKYREELMPLLKLIGR